MCADFCRNWKAAKERRHEGCCWSHGLCMTVASDKKGCHWTCNIFKDLQSCLIRITASQHGQLASWSVGQLVSCDSPLCSKVLTVAMHFKLRTEHQFKYPTRIALSALDLCNSPTCFGFDLTTTCWFDSLHAMLVSCTLAYRKRTSVLNLITARSGNPLARHPTSGALQWTVSGVFDEWDGWIPKGAALTILTVDVRLMTIERSYCRWW